MGRRAPASGIHLSADDAALIKGMLRRGDRQHDIAAWFGVNGGRVAEIAVGVRFRQVAPAHPEELPPCGPYPNGAQAFAAIDALASAKSALAKAESVIRSLAKG